MTTIEYSITKGVEHLSPADPINSEILARKMLDIESITAVNLQLALIAHVIAVFRWSGVDRKGGQDCAGWLVGGTIPHLVLNDDEIITPVEAIAIYALFLKEAINFKGEHMDDDNVPKYRMPTDWSILTFENGFKEKGVGFVYNWIIWIILRRNSNEIHNSYIRQVLLKKGWILD